MTIDPSVTLHSDKWPLRHEGINEPEPYITPIDGDKWPLRHPIDPIDAIVSERGKKYGPPEVNHQTTADFFYIYLMRVGDRRINRRDVAMLNILQKISRDLYSPQPDNLVDIKEYATNAERMAEKEER